MKIDVIYNNLLQSAQKNASDYAPEKKMSKRQSSEYPRVLNILTLFLWKNPWCEFSEIFIIYDHNHMLYNL